MPIDLDRPTSYRAPINLYVEDQTTLAYLKELWLDPAIAYFLGGNNEGVDAIVKVDQKAGHRNVFGLIDRDYGQSNQSQWKSPENRLFKLASHEVENFLLDAPALKSSRWSNLGRSADEIETLLFKAAQKLCWYEACRCVLGTIRSRFHEDFIKKPQQNLPDIEAAKRHLCGSDWFRRLAGNATKTTEAEISHLLGAAHAQATIQLADTTWKQEFSGKAIFKDVASRICDLQGFPEISTSQLHCDIAEDVARWHSTNGRIPPELIDLRAALRRQVGLG